MPLIEKSYIKQNFPSWDHYTAYDTVAANDDDALDNQIAEAETELGQYITVTDTTITDSIKRHLFRIVVKNLFMLKHADTEFEREPAILRDYNKSIKMLEALRDGHAPSAAPTPETQQEGLKITSKARRFGPGQGFRDTGNYKTTSEDE
nr:hypothetical protein 19 [Balneolaceae bacterium]